MADFTSQKSIKQIPKKKLEVTAMFIISTFKLGVGGRATERVESRQSISPRRENKQENGIKKERELAQWA